MTAWRPSNWEELKNVRVKMHYPNFDNPAFSAGIEIGFDLATFCYRRAGIANYPGHIEQGRWVFIKADEEEPD